MTCSENDFCGKVNQSVTYVHSCLQLTILIGMSTNNPIWNSVVLNFKKSLCQSALAEESRTTDFLLGLFVCRPTQYKQDGKL